MEQGALPSRQGEGRREIVGDPRTANEEVSGLPGSHEAGFGEDKTGRTGSERKPRFSPYRMAAVC